MRGLAHRFGLELTDLYAVPNPGSPRFWLDGELRRRRNMRDARAVFIRALERVARRVGSYTAANHNAAGVSFDAITVKDFLDATLDHGGANSPLGRYVSVDMASEFGLDADRLSALNLLFEYVENTPGADERYHVLGGNDQIVAGLAAALPDGTIHLDAPLQALSKLGDGSFSLSFGGLAGAVSADRVVLALPFTTLREVDLSAAGLSRRKRRCIDDLGMGTNAKVTMQFERRPQAYGRWNGYMYSDDPVLLTWESTLGEPGGQSIVTTYFGGRSGAAGLDPDSAHAPTTPAEVERNLASLTQDGHTHLPGLAAGFGGQGFTDHWVADPWVRGSYAAFLPGQYTKYYGYVGKPEGAIHFAGEHTATTNQGYLEGAVESGVRCAGEIARSLR
jgi:monoamine oxidase